jgi:hypothetical protein
MPMPKRKASMMKTQRVVLIKDARAGDRRHPETLSYRCCLSTLAGFERLCRAGPARTAEGYPNNEAMSNA